MYFCDYIMYKCYVQIGIPGFVYGILRRGVLNDAKYTMNRVNSSMGYTITRVNSSTGYTITRANSSAGYIMMRFV